jgi:hypothetical protein
MGQYYNQYTNIDKLIHPIQRIQVLLVLFCVFVCLILHSFTTCGGFFFHHYTPDVKLLNPTELDLSNYFRFTNLQTLATLISASFL